MEKFSGSKIALFIGEKLLVYLRDEREGLLYSGMWDLPGGGQEENETPEECVIREVKEEFDLDLQETDLIYKSYKLNSRGNRIYFFAAHCPPELEMAITFGDEGQFYKLDYADNFLNEETAIPHLKAQLEKYLWQKSN